MISDEQLLLASRAEPARFTALFDRHHAAIHTYLRRRLGSQLADELAAETFLRAFQGRRNYQADRGPVRVWLFGIATNLLRRHYRSEHRRLAAYARAVPAGSEPDQTDRVDDRVAAGALGATLAGSLAAMRNQDRDVLVLVAWADLTYAEVASALDIPIGTVRSRLARARKEIKSCLVAAEENVRATKGVVVHG